MKERALSSCMIPSHCLGWSWCCSSSLNLLASTGMLFSFCSFCHTCTLLCKLWCKLECLDGPFFTRTVLLWVSWMASASPCPIRDVVTQGTGRFLVWGPLLTMIRCCSQEYWVTVWCGAGNWTQGSACQTCAPTLDRFSWPSLVFFLYFYASRLCFFTLAHCPSPSSPTAHMLMSWLAWCCPCWGPLLRAQLALAVFLFITGLLGAAQSLSVLGKGNAVWFSLFILILRRLSLWAWELFSFWNDFEQHYWGPTRDGHCILVFGHFTFFLFSVFFGHTWLCLGLNLGSVLRDHSGWYSDAHMGSRNWPQSILLVLSLQPPMFCIGTQLVGHCFVYIIVLLGLENIV